MSTSKQSKSKPITTSVPSFAIRFHANGEELEELYPSEEEEKSEKSTTEEKPAENISETSKHESSPMRDYLNKFGKRSSSIDTGINETSLGQPASDPWRIFSEFKGKLTKTVEEKLSEIKSKNSEEGSPKHLSKSDKNKTGSKENSSVSDSEEQSFSECSIPKSSGLNSTVEDLEMSSEDENSLADNEKTPTENSKDFLLEPTKRHVLRHRISKNPTKSFVQFTSAKDSDSESHVKISSLSTVLERDTGEDDVESGVEACEELVNSPKEISPENDCVTLIAPTGFVDMRFIGLNSPNKHFRLAVLWSILVIFISVCVFFPLPRFLVGFLTGCFVTAGFCFVYYKLYVNDFEFEVRNKIRKKSLVDLPILQVPAVKEYQPVTKFEGWMNEFPDHYDPRTYHIMKTQSVFLKLEGSILRISHTRAKIPKRAMWDEPKHKVSFTHHRIYNLHGSQVTLLPTGLIHKRLWSKKYPICIILNKEKMGLDINVDKKDDEMDNEEDVKTGKKSATSKDNETYADPLVEQLDDLVEVDQTQMPEEDKDLCTESFSDAVLEEDKDEISITTEDWDTLTFEEANQIETKIYLFARTCRDKEDWYRRLAIATRDPSLESDKTSEEIQTSTPQIEQNETTIPNPPETTEQQQTVETNKQKTDDEEEDYLKYMSRFNKVQKTVHAHSSKRLFFRKKKKKSAEEELDDDLELSHDNNSWINAVILRIIYDVRKHEQVIESFQRLIQKKISTIKLPYFIETIVMSDLSPGKSSPAIHNIYEPVLDERGLWIHMDITYEGVTSMAIVTKLNLMKLKEQAGKQDENVVGCDDAGKSPIFHSDVEDSAESSDDETAAAWILQSVSSADGTQTSTPRKPNTGGKKFLQMVDKIASSKYFQQATENKFIKRAMEGVSKTEIKLTVEIQYLSGMLVLNIPPPPSDRIWIGFRGNPELQLSALPTFGERSINFMHVSRWIEKKLAVEFQKFLVLPNMEDFVLPFLIPKLPQ